jgi:hypothetical protein
MRKWLGLELAYRYHVHQAPEFPATACLDCGRDSPNGLTPCDQGRAEAAA